MAVVTTYAWSILLAPTLLNNLQTGNQGSPFIATRADGSWRAFWNEGDTTYSREMNADGTFVSPNEPTLDPLSASVQDGSATMLADGGYVVAYVELSTGNQNGDIEFAYVGPNGSVHSQLVRATPSPESNPDVAALADGGFVITWTDGGGAVEARVFNADLTPRTNAFNVDAGPVPGGRPCVTGLTGGGFVVAFSEQAGADFVIKARLFNANGQPSGATITLDDVGSINRYPDILALPNGGFVMAYTDNGWDTGTTEITGRIYGADGAPTSGFFKINQPAQTLNQTDVVLVLLSDNVWAAGWRTEVTNQGVFQAFSLTGAPLGDPQFVNNVANLDLAAVNGTMIMAWEAPNGDSDGTGILGSMRNLVRTSSSDVASDQIIGDDLIDVMTGGGGADVLAGRGGDDNLSGGAQNDSVLGDDGDDVLSGGTGDDTLVGGAGADALDGGLNFDEAYYLGAAGSVTINLATGTHTGEAQGDTFVSIEQYRLSDFDDTFTAGAAGVVAIGEGGNDLLIGGAGVDQFLGGAGNDILIGGQGSDSLNGGAGFDIASYATAQAAVTVNLNGGSSLGDAAGDTFIDIDRFFLSSHGDAFVGGAMADDVDGRNGNDTLNGGDGNDDLRGSGGDDTLFGGLGLDLAGYGAAAGAVTVNLTTGHASDGDGGTDLLLSIERVAGSQFDDSLTGDSFANELSGGLGEDILTGLGGDDLLIGGAGYNQLFGGDGNDTYIVSSGSDHITEIPGEGVDHVISHITSITLAANVENLTYVGAGNFLGDGNALDNVIHGSVGADTLWGEAGDDELHGGTGESNTLVGGAGDDVYFVETAQDVIIESVAEGIDTVATSLTTYALGSHVENLGFISPGDHTGSGNALNNAMYGNAGGDTLNGALGDDILSGEGGEDVLKGGAGDDVVYGGDDRDQLFGADGKDAMAGGEADDLIQGGADNDQLWGDDGDDSLNGGSGADDMMGGNGYDTVSYYGATVAISVNLATGTASGGWAQGDTFVGIENLFGSNKADTLTGDGGANVLNGAGGDDIVDGGAGNDDLLGNGGHDLLKGGDGGDALTGGTGDDTLQGAAGNDILNGGSGADLLQGGGENDTLIGGSENDTLQGAVGDDILDGGSGNDQLSGGAGSDRFVFGGGWGQDKIADFTAGAGLNDVIAFASSVFSNFNELLAATTNDGLGNCVIVKGANTLTLTGVLKSNLNADDFQFVAPIAPQTAAEADVLTAPRLTDDLDPLVLPVGLEGKAGADDTPVICLPDAGEPAVGHPWVDLAGLGLSSFEGRDPHRFLMQPGALDWIV